MEILANPLKYSQVQSILISCFEVTRDKINGFNNFHCSQLQTTTNTVLFTVELILSLLIEKQPVNDFHDLHLKELLLDVIFHF